MIILEDILSQEIVQRLGWTLLHFIWQAAAVALFLAILLRLLRKSTANLRYIIACLALALIVLLPVITIRLVPVSTPPPAIHITPAHEPTLLSAVEMPAPETIVIAKPSRPESVYVVPSISFKQRAVNMLEPALPYIVTGWLIGVFALSIWHLGGWTQLQRLKRRMVKQVDSILLNKLKILTQKLKVKQTVRLMESALVQIPTVVGWLRPVILLPASALTGLNTEQLEAIIAHELAHIKRFDYLINILQTVVETLGFYHPAVWWVSYKIRAERENCCDDIAVSISGDRISYAGALASMEEIRAAHGKLAIAATGGNLFRRICRLLGKESTDNTGLSWVPAATAILLIIALAIPTTLALTNKYRPEQALSKTNEFSPIKCTGRIVDSTGDAVATAMVEAYEMYFDKAGNLKLRLIGKSVTKDDGKFLFKSTPTVKKNRSDGGLVIAQKEGLAIGWANWPLYDGNQKTNITLQEPTKLSGIVIDDNGKPVPNAEVRAVLFEDKTTRYGKVSWLPGIRPSDWLSVHTDMNGMFEFDNIPQNITSDLLVTAPGFGTMYSRKPNRIDKGYEWAEFKAGQTDIGITMSPEAEIEGKLVHKKTGKGMAGITLRVIPHFTPVFFERYLCTTQKDGTFSIGGLRTGKYAIMRAGSRNLKVDVEVESGKRTRNVILKYPDDIRNSKPVNSEIKTPNLNEQQSDEDKVHVVKANCLVVEVPLDSKIDTETLKEADNILGNKINLRNTKVNIILRQVAKATAAARKEFTENKRITEQQFNAFIKMLTSKGYIKILMNPMIQVVDGQKAELVSTLDSLQESSLEITPHVFEDGDIILEVKADIRPQDTPAFDQQTPAILRQFSSQLLAKPGESLIMGGLIANPLTPEGNIKNTEEQVKELLFIITPSIITPPADSKETADTQIDVKRVLSLSAHKLKLLGLAVAMYADDHDDDLPESIEELKPYIRNGQDFDWLRDNVEYFDKGKSAQRNAHSIPIAYDSKPPEKADGTNVLFLDFSVRFVDKKEFEKLYLKRTEFLIDIKFLSVSKDFLKRISLDANSPKEAKSTLRLTNEALKNLVFSKRESLILNDHDVNLLLSAVKINKDSKVFANPKIVTPEGKTAEITTAEQIPIITGYTEPNNPSEKSQPKFDYVETGISMSLRPNLTPDNNIDMQFEVEITQVIDFEKLEFEGKTTHKPRKVETITQATRYIVKNGQTLLFGAHKIAVHQNGQTEHDDLLILIKAQIVGPPEQDKPAKTENLIITEPAIIQTRTERPKNSGQETTESATEQKSQMIQKFFKLKYHDASKMARILKPLLTEIGHISTDERTNSLIVIDTAENLMRIEKAIAQYDISKPDETVIEVFEIRNGDPVEIVELLKKLINGRPDTASVIESSNGPIVLIPELKRKWIIVRASPENMKQIGQWIEKLDTDKSTMGLDPIDRAAHEKLETIVDLSHLSPQMSFAEVVEHLENSVEPPMQIQPIWKDLLENAEVEQATPAGMDPLTRVKLRKALEILLTSVSSTGLPKLTYVVDEGVILIGTAEMLPPKLDGIRSSPDELRESNLPSTMKVPREELMTPLEQIQKQLDELLIKQQQAPKVTEPNLPLAPKVTLLSDTFIDCPIIDALKNIAAEANVTIIPDETVKGFISCTFTLKDVTVETALDIILAGTPYVWKKTPNYYLVFSEADLPKMVHRVYDIYDLVFESANYRMLGNRSMKMSGMGGGMMGGGMGGGIMGDQGGMMGDMGSMMGGHGGYMQAQSLVQLIQETIEPDSWFGLSDTGEGTIMAYPMHSPSKLAVMQTYKIHQQITRFLEDTRSSRREWEKTNPEIMIETVFLSVSEDYLKYVGLDADTANFSDGWARLLAAEYPAGPNGQPYGLIIDDLHIRFLLKAVQAHHDSKSIVAPRAHTRAGTTAETGIIEEYRYIKGYNEPNSPSEEPQPKRDKVKLGPLMWLTPKLNDDNNRNVNLDLKLEMRQLEGIIEGKYKGKYPYYKPVVDIISAKMPCTIPDGKTMLIGGLEMSEQVTEKTRTPGLKDMPLIGGAFRSKDKTTEPKMLLILIKPVINPQQKATKILPGQEDSEEQVRRLAEQLDKKIKSPAN